MLMSMKPSTIPKPLNRITSSISDHSIPTVIITLYALSFESPTSRNSTAFWLHIRRSRLHVPLPHCSNPKVAGFRNQLRIAELHKHSFGPGGEQRRLCPDQDLTLALPAGKAIRLLSFRLSLSSVKFASSQCFHRRECDRLTV